MRSPATLLLALLVALPLAQALPEPDFRAEIGEQTTANAAPGQVVGFSIVVRNSGGDSMATGEIGWYVDGDLAFTGWLPQMLSGEQQTFSWTWTATPGMHEVHVVVNDNLHVPETMTSNNVWYFQPIEVAPPPSDIAVVALHVEHARLRTDFGDVPNPVGDRTIRVDVCNLGQGPLAGGTLAVSVAGASAGGSTLATLGVGPLDPGVCAQQALTWTPVAAFGDVDVTAVVAGGENTNLANDQMTYRDFVVVGGLNRGVALL